MAHIVLHTGLYSDAAFNVVSCFYDSLRLARSLGGMELVVRTLDNEVVVISSNTDNMTTFTDLTKLGKAIEERMLRNVIMVKNHNYVTYNGLYGNKKLDLSFFDKTLGYNLLTSIKTDDHGVLLEHLDRLNITLANGTMKRTYIKIPVIDIFGIAMILQKKNKEAEKNDCNVKELIGRPITDPFLLAARDNCIQEVCDYITQNINYVAFYRDDSIEDMKDIVKKYDMTGLSFNEYFETLSKV